MAPDRSRTPLMWPEKRWRDCSWHERGFMLAVYGAGAAAIAMALMLLATFPVPHG